MAVDRLLRTVLSFKEVKSRHDDDFVDRLSRTYTTSLLILLAFVVSTKQFVGEPMSCWCPAYFTDSHRSYTNTICCEKLSFRSWFYCIYSSKFKIICKMYRIN